MGFCRRCGEIVVGPRCKCGGIPVAPVVPWCQLNTKERTQDKWSKTYVSRDKSPARPLSPGPSINHGVPSRSTGTHSGSPTKCFPRPITSSNATTTNSTQMGSRVAAHIASTTSYINRPPSPLKHSTTGFSDPVPESGILPSPHTSTLAKVYGSVLQPKETLTMHSCAICAAPFLPDATIYPDPNDPSNSTRFLCRSCFTTNGGSKGLCPSCSRPVLTLKSEGGYVAAAGKVWHKKCFRCDGCFKSIGDTPMVDLLGKPSCVECFDSCLKRDGNTPKKKKWDSPHGERGSNSNLGGMKTGKSREGSPAIEELEQRLGIAKSREGSPTLEELSHRLSTIGKNSERRSSAAGRGGSPGTPLSKSLRGKADLQDDRSSPSPIRRYERSKSLGGSSPGSEGGSISPIRYTPTGGASPQPTEEAIEAMKRRFLNGSSATPSSSPNSPRTSLARGSSPGMKSPTPSSKIPIATSVSRQGSMSPYSFKPSASGLNELNKEQAREASMPPVPDLMSDFSDTTTQSSGPNSPPRDDVDVDVFDDEGTIRGRGRNRSVGGGSFSHDEYGYRRGDFFDEGDGGVTPTRSPKSRFTSTSVSKTKLSTGPTTNHPGPHLSIPPPLPPSATCARCHGALFNLQSNAMGGRFVTVPEEPRESGQEPKTYHTECFRCVVCDGLFREDGMGKAIFVRGEQGACHVECAQPKKISVRSIPNSSPISIVSTSPPKPSPTYTPTYSTSSRYDRPPVTAPPTSTPISFPRFGGGISCPGCLKSVSPMERGVVPGPQSTRWHAACLVCGGKKVSAKGTIWGRREDKKKGEPGCGKKLDSAAKGDGEGGIWCRECLLLLPVEMRGSPHGSPTRSVLAPSYTGSGSSRVTPQFTGTTTLARQFTGLGATDAALMRQLTGGGLSPTRQLDRLGSPTKGLDRSGSPTKQLTMIRERPRPKSVIGMRSLKSIDEGRGMLLVRQMTGSAGGWE